MTLLHCIQVPEELCADEWHFQPAGFDEFAKLFAERLVCHLRERGVAVEGRGLRRRERVRVACVLKHIRRMIMLHMRVAGNDCLIIDYDLKTVRACRDIWCIAAKYARAIH